MAVAGRSLAADLDLEASHILAPVLLLIPRMISGSWKENEVEGFRRIFTIAFLLFIAPAGGTIPAGQSFTFT